MFERSESGVGKFWLALNASVTRTSQSVRSAASSFDASAPSVRAMSARSVDNALENFGSGDEVAQLSTC